MIVAVVLVMVAEMTYGECYIASVPASLPTLGTENIYTGFKSFGDMFWMPDHIHYRDFGSVKSIDCLFWRHS